MEKRSHRCSVTIISLLLILAICLAGCGESGTSQTSEAPEDSEAVIRILSGSENKELEPILKDYEQKNHVKIEMTYAGSLDIMRSLQKQEFKYDAVWPASSIWLNAGDTMRRVRHAESISTNPVVFGIRKSLAEKLGFVGKKVSVSDILQAIENGELKFCMTSASQSNSGASAYLGFIHAWSGTDTITSKTLKDEHLQEKLTRLLAGIDRSSGSSEWLKDMFVKGDYDAMVNYECLMIAANRELTKKGEEPLYVVYPYDGLSIADSPLGYVDQKDEEKEKLFLDLQKYLLSDEVQDKIQKTGRRTGYTGISDSNKSVFKSEWGLQPDRVMSPFKMPSGDVLEEALNLYQTKLRKPSLTVYCLDYSGSMRGEGYKQLTEAMSQILIRENAKKNFLQIAPEDVSILIPFNEAVMDVCRAKGPAEAEDLYQKVEAWEPDGGTNMYVAIQDGIMEATDYHADEYTVSIVVMTDGMSVDEQKRFMTLYRALDEDIPIFSIMYGDADPSQLESLAKASNARVFDGRKDLVGAFRKVRGYN